MVGEEQRVDVLCSRTSYDNQPCRDPPGFLSVMKWPGWIVLMGIKILFVIKTQTRKRDEHAAKLMQKERKK